MSIIRTASITSSKRCYLPRSQDSRRDIILVAGVYYDICCHFIQYYMKTDTAILMKQSA